MIPIPQHSNRPEVCVILFVLDPKVGVPIYLESLV